MKVSTDDHHRARWQYPHKARRQENQVKQPGREDFVRAQSRRYVDGLTVTTNERVEEGASVEFQPICDNPLSKRDFEGESSTDVVNLDELVELGWFSSPHGLRGELKFQATTDAVEERLQQDVARWAWMKGRRKPQCKRVEIAGFRSTISKGNIAWLVRLVDVNSVEAAESYRGLTLGMLAVDRPDLESDDEFYVQDLVGMQVVQHSDKSPIGTVTDIYDGTGEHDLMRVELSANPSGKCLVPFVKEIVPIIHIEEGVVEIDPPEGLLDLRALVKANSTPPNKSKKRRRRDGRPTENACEA